MLFDALIRRVRATSAAPTQADLDTLLSKATALDVELTPQPDGGAVWSGGACVAAETGTLLGPSQNISPAVIASQTRLRPFVIGHNAALFDLPELQRLSGHDLSDRLVIDTLWLSPLAFPTKISHRLEKAYLQATPERGNDPAEDARMSIALLRREFSAIAGMDPRWRRVLAALCTLGRRDGAYRELFGAMLDGVDPRGAVPLTADTVLELLPGEVCRLNLDRRLRQAQAQGDGWPLAWALSWILHRDRRKAPATWVMAGFPEVRATLDDLRAGQCQDRSCRRCRQAGETIHRMARWFPPPTDGVAAFQPPVAPDGETYQEKIMAGGLDRRSLLGILPTGTGKSRCFQVAALEQHARTGDLTVVISPLKSLMEDQARKAEAAGLPGVARLHGDMDALSRAQVHEALRNGEVALLYVAPERLGNEAMQDLLWARRIGLWVFDEAHCLTSWGQGFRSDYRRVVKWIRRCGCPGSEAAAVMCLTATARPETREDIRRLFAVEAGLALELIDGGPHRANLSYLVREAEDDSAAQFEAMLRDPAMLPDDGQAVVFVRRRETAEALAAALAAKGLCVAAYHAGMSPETKAGIEGEFFGGGVRILVATIAFGMGVDAPNVRLVVHAEPAASLEAYAQEAGRAGRNGCPAQCVLMWDPQAADKQFEDLVRGHVAREEIEAVLGHILDRQAQVRDARGTKFPVLSLRYDEVAQTVLDRPSPHWNGKSPDGAAMEKYRRWSRDRLDRILAELERHGLVEKVARPPDLSKMEVDEPILRRMAADTARAPATEAAIVRLLARQDSADGRGLVLPAAIEDLAAACGLPGQVAVEKCNAALSSLRAKGLLRWRIEIDVTLPKGREPETQLTRWTEEQFAIVAAIGGLVEALHEQQAEPAVEDALIEAVEEGVSTPLDLRTSLVELTKRANEFLGAASLLTPRRVLDHLAELGGEGGFRHVLERLSLSAPLSLTLALGADEFAAQVQLRHDRLRRVLASLRAICGADLSVLSELRAVTAAVIANGLDLDGLWRRGGGDEMPRSEAEQLMRSLLTQLSRAKSIVLGPGLFSAFDERSVVVADRQVGVRRNSYTEMMYREGVDAFQQEEVRQLHLMHRFALKVAEAQDAAAELLKDYFERPSAKALERFFSGDELEVVRRNRPAGIARQTELRARLDDQQAEVVHGGAGLSDMLVLAGPGSGKTRVLVERVIWLVSVERAPPDQILMLCYNRRAAQEIRARLRAADALGRRGAAVLVQTYHAFALQVLGRSYAELSDAAVAEERQASDTMLDRGQAAETFGRILRDAGRRLAENRAAGRSIADFFLRKFRWVLVDEFQDVTEDSFALISEISQQSQKKKRSEAGSISDLIDVRFCAVGDDDQNIYDFGGASGQYISRFDELFPGAQRKELTWNYRSTGAIISAAADVISRTSERMKRSEVSVDPARCGAPPEGLYHDPQDPLVGKVRICLADAGDDDSQAAFAVAELKRLAQKVPLRRWRWSSTAILVRRRSQIAIVERALMANGIEVTRDIRNLVPFERVQEAVRVRDWLESAERNGRWLSANDLTNAADWLQAKYDNRWSAPLAGRLRDMVEEHGQDGAGSGEAISARELLDDFVEWARAFVPGQTGVTVMTAHSSKGLEFDNVVVLDAEWLKATSGHITDADRRLLYVAATRARYSLSFVTAEGGALQRLMSLDYPGMVRSDARPAPSMRIAGEARTYQPASVRDVFLSYPVWNGWRCEQDDRTISENLRQIARLKAGDPLLLAAVSKSADRNNWHVHAISGGGDPYRVGKMEAGYSPGRREREQVHGRVFALVRWKLQDSDEEHHHKIRREEWFTVVPEWEVVN